MIGAILGLDGKPFQLTGSLAQFDPNNPAHALFDVWDAEIIRIGGTPIYYYEVFIQPQTVDPLYFEDRGKLWSNFPVTLYGYYEPPRQSNPSGLFGIDTPDEEIIIECNTTAVLKALGHPPKRGSRVYTPHRQENWIIIDVKLDQFKYWGALHLNMHCKKFQESSTDSSSVVDQPRQDFSVPPHVSTPPPQF